MKNLIYIISCIIILTSCNNEVENVSNTNSQPTSDSIVTDTNTLYNDEVFDDMPNFEQFFIVIVDSSTNYSVLDKKMYQLSLDLSLTIDTMNRYYNVENDLISLPLDDDDELYAGEYYPRRYPSIHLSLEYLDFYEENIDEKVIGLVAGIFETKHAADSLNEIINSLESNSFVLKGNIYTGCMH